MKRHGLLTVARGRYRTPRRGLIVRKLGTNRREWWGVIDPHQDNLVVHEDRLLVDVARRALELDSLDPPEGGRA